MAIGTVFMNIPPKFYEAQYKIKTKEITDN